MKYYTGKLQNYELDHNWWLHGMHKDDGVTYEFYGTIDEIVEELKSLESKASIDKSISLMGLYENSTRQHSFQDYLSFLTPTIDVL